MGPGPCLCPDLSPEVSRPRSIPPRGLLCPKEAAVSPASGPRPSPPLLPVDACPLPPRAGFGFLSGSSSVQAATAARPGSAPPCLLPSCPAAPSPLSRLPPRPPRPPRGYRNDSWWPCPAASHAPRLTLRAGLGQNVSPLLHFPNEETEARRG